MNLHPRIYSARLQRQAVLTATLEIQLVKFSTYIKCACGLV